MTTMEILGIKVKTHNARERKVVNIMNDEIRRNKRYLKDNTFDDNTISIVRRNLIKLNHQFTALYFMDLVPKACINEELEKEFDLIIY